MERLFDPPEEERGEEPADGPLAARMRPRTLAEFVGQEHLLGEGSALRVAIGEDRVRSAIFFGPPGSGKTTLARIVAATTGAAFEELSAVSASVADVRAVLARARERLGAQGQRTILFLDEIHRFNKAQQDALLPAVEEGLVTLIGATTENPSFEVISPLLSRSRVFRLEGLSPEDLEVVAARGLRELAKEIEPEALGALVEAARGDGRIVLNALETAAALSPSGAISLDAVERALQERHLLYDRAGDMHYDLASALIKSIRGSDPDAAVYWLARMLDAGEDANFVSRRLVISAAEDVGLADPQALPVAVAAQQAAHFVGMPEARLPLSEATIYLARAPKSNSAYRAYGAASQAVRETGNLPVPLHLRNAVTGLMRSMGYGQGYRYAHDYQDATVEQQHLPDQLQTRHFYEPTERDKPLKEKKDPDQGG